MRIIAGHLKGKKLYAVRGTNTRPTADRLRESIFNILAAQVQGSAVLDLFAGTGALGIEALSRGADSAVFIDKEKRALAVIERNVRACSLGHRSKIIKWDILRNLNCLIPMREALNLVLMDPPYNRNCLKPALMNLHRSRCLEKGACMVVEHSAAETIPQDLAEFTIADQRRYGKTLVSFLNYVV